MHLLSLCHTIDLLAEKYCGACNSMLLCYIMGVALGVWVASESFQD